MTVGNNTRNVIFDGENSASVMGSFDYSTYIFRLYM